MGTTSQVSDASFEADVLKATNPVLVDFWAEWCGPCKMIAPALEEIAKELGDKVRVVKLNVDHNPQTPKKYGVHGQGSGKMPGFGLRPAEPGNETWEMQPFKFFGEVSSWSPMASRLGSASGLWPAADWHVRGYALVSHRARMAPAVALHFFSGAAG